MSQIVRVIIPRGRGDAEVCAGDGGGEFGDEFFSGVVG